MLKRHLDLALEKGYRVHINGDFFCLMQGKYDPRKAKGSIRKEHNVNNYFDAVIETAVEWFKPYAEIIDVIGYGNHETSIIRRLETDPLQRFVDLLNYTVKPETKVHTGGYGGWYVIRIDGHTYKIRYYHGSGGGGVVTKGHIILTRAFNMYGGFDCFTMGHVHENTERYDSLNCINNRYKPYLREVLMMITGTYKEEYVDGYMGWHTETGKPPKPIGGRLLSLKYFKDSKSDRTIKASSKKIN